MKSTISMTGTLLPKLLLLYNWNISTLLLLYLEMMWFQFSWCPCGFFCFGCPKNACLIILPASRRLQHPVSMSSVECGMIVDTCCPCVLTSFLLQLYKESVIRLCTSVHLLCAQELTVSLCLHCRWDPGTRGCCIVALCLRWALSSRHLALFLLTLGSDRKGNSLHSNGNSYAQCHCWA